VSVVFQLDSRTLEEPAAVHATATLGTLLDHRFEIVRSGEAVPEGAAVVYVGDPRHAPPDCAAVVPCEGWPAWNLDDLKPAETADGVLPCPSGNAGTPGGERSVPGACLRALGFLLHREEELLDPRRDQWNCFSGLSTQLHGWGLLERPLVNEWAHQLSIRVRAWAERKHRVFAPVPRWKDGRRFAVALTHDVDWMLRYSLPQALRLLAQTRSPRQYAFRQGVRSVTEALLHPVNRDDPYCRFDRWIDEESQRGFRSTFFFCPPAPRPRHEYDPTYRLTDRARYRSSRLSVADLIAKLAASGAEIGLHGSYQSYESAAELARQRDEIAGASGVSIQGVRQHYLRFAVERTWGAQEAAGFAYDATLGYNEAIGFRASVSAPFHPYDVRQRSARRLLELPTTLMDGTLFRTLDLDAPQAISRIESHLDAVERAGGLAVLLWHPNATDRAAFPGWWESYVGALDVLGRRDAWVTTTGEIAAWWRDRERRMMGSRDDARPAIRGFV
jgi:peptidoglycan/xylan/chitin deacetylase (PgdA/CDA1 family)